MFLAAASSNTMCIVISLVKDAGGISSSGFFAYRTVPVRASISTAERDAGSGAPETQEASGSGKPAKIRVGTGHTRRHKMRERKNQSGARKLMESIIAARRKPRKKERSGIDVSGREKMKHTSMA
jgi:hypothetical protein